LRAHNKKDFATDEYLGDREDNVVNDPVVVYGPGVHSYFLMQRRLLRTMFIISLMSIPLVIGYYSVGGMNVDGFSKNPI
jgi:hypothetical protein